MSKMADGESSNPPTWFVASLLLTSAIGVLLSTVAFVIMEGKLLVRRAANQVEVPALQHPEPAPPLQRQEGEEVPVPTQRAGTHAPVPVPTQLPSAPRSLPADSATSAAGVEPFASGGVVQGEERLQLGASTAALVAGPRVGYIGALDGPIELHLNAARAPALVEDNNPRASGHVPISASNAGETTLSTADNFEVAEVIDERQATEEQTSPPLPPLVVADVGPVSDEERTPVDALPNPFVEPPSTMVRPSLGAPDESRAHPNSLQMGLPASMPGTLVAEVGTVLSAGTGGSALLPGSEHMSSGRHEAPQGEAGVGPGAVPPRPPRRLVSVGRHDTKPSGSISLHGQQVAQLYSSGAAAAGGAGGSDRDVPRGASLDRQDAGRKDPREKNSRSSARAGSSNSRKGKKRDLDRDP